MSALQSSGAIKRQIFEKFLDRMKKMGVHENCDDANSCPELNPDVIVTSGDQTLFFEPQNERAADLLRRCCGVDAEILAVGEKIRVHPCESQKITEVLSAAGLKVAS